MRASGPVFVRLRAQWIAPLAAASAFLCLAAVPAVAGGPVKATGTVVSETDAKITMEFQRNGGEPSAVPLFKVKGLDFSCFDGGDSGEFKVTVERFFDVERGLDAKGNRIWNLFTKRDTVKTDDFGRVGLFVSGTTNRKANKVDGTIGISFGGGCTNDTSDGFDVYKLTAPR